MEDYQQELLINQAAEMLPPAHFKDFKRLAREVAAYRGRWGLFFIKYQHTRDISSVSAAIAKLVPRVGEVIATNYADVMALEQAMVDLLPDCDLIHLRGMDDWLGTFPDAEVGNKRLRAWNLSREYFAHNVTVPVICWVRPATLQKIGLDAPDLWSWRVGVYEFFLLHETNLPLITPMGTLDYADIDNRTLAQRTQRIHDLQHYLAQTAPQNEIELNTRALLLDELASLLLSIGDLDSALQIRNNEELPIYQQLDSPKGKAIALGRIADIMLQQGKLDEAMRILQELVLPVFVQLNDLREKTITQMKIAETLYLKGELDQALQILQEQVLPACTALQDNSFRAGAYGRIAAILRQRGELTQALNILNQETLPVFEKLGNLQQWAINLFAVAEILAEQGKLEQSMAILRDKILPIVKKTGDVRGRTITFGRIAEILAQRGEIEQAISIYKNDVLPPIEKMGDVRSLFFIQQNLAVLLLKRNAPGDIGTARRLLAQVHEAGIEMKMKETSPIPDLLAKLDTLEQNQAQAEGSNQPQ